MEYCQYIEKEGILSAKFGTGGTALSCSPEEIALYRICRAIEPDFPDKLIGIHAVPSRLCPVGQRIHCVLDAFYHTVREGLRKSLQSIGVFL